MASDIRTHQPYSNPIALPDLDQQRSKGSLTNDDFRQLLTTPRHTEDTNTTISVSSSENSVKKKEQKRPRKISTSNDEWLAKLRKEEEEREAEWAKKYRDRAKERREGNTPSEPVSDNVLQSTSGYRAVAPNTNPTLVARQRKQTIAESKFLGGDMEHTHLVKGLDFALLQKVKSEMAHTERETENERKRIEIKRQREREKEKKLAAMSDEVTFKTRIAKNIHTVLFETRPNDKNELFLLGRMAYVFELDDEFAESDIPTTLIRSKADCPSLESQTTISTNDIVINKLTQILSYLRQGARASKKSKKRERGVNKETVSTRVKKPKPSTTKKGDSIFDNVGEYMFDPKAAAGVTNQDVQYFDKTPLQEETMETPKDIHMATHNLVKAVGKKYANTGKIPGIPENQLPTGWSGGETDKTRKSDSGKSTKELPGNIGFGGFGDEHYAECYPGGMEEVDATVNSDDEADFMKMDMGNHKGPVKRWDFDNEEDYGEYQSNREAMPKAAFQYGVKMNDGRKTRRQGVKNEKAKINREWQQISQIIQKRKVKEINVVSKRLKTE